MTELTLAEQLANAQKWYRQNRQHIFDVVNSEQRDLGPGVRIVDPKVFLESLDWWDEHLSEVRKAGEISESAFLINAYYLQPLRKLKEICKSTGL